MKTTRILILAGIVAAGLPALASAATSANEGYLVDSSGSIVKSGFGACWHTAYWTPALAVSGCDFVPVKQSLAPVPEEVSALSLLPPTAAGPKEVPLPKINFLDAAHFNFDEAVLKPEGKEMLDGLVRELGGATYGAIHVIGHADRIGSTEYNQGLSLRRANEAKSYLVSKGIPADRIKVEGKGEMQPVTKPTDCTGLTRARTIACLQPDRRVEVSVAGSKGAAADKK